jgi:hypothetical protein
VDVLGDAQAQAAMPASPVQDQHDLLLGPRPHGTREGLQLGLKERDGDRGRQVKERALIDLVAGPAIARLQPVIGQVGFEADALWHAPVLQWHGATPYHRHLDGGSAAGVVAGEAQGQPGVVYAGVKVASRPSSCGRLRWSTSLAVPDVPSSAWSW